MRIRQPGVNRPHRHLDRERSEEPEPQPSLHMGRKGGLEQHRDVGRSRGPVHGHDREQHQHRAGERVEEELEGRVHAVPVAPDANDDEHRDEAALEEQIKEHQVERDEDADHQRLHHQEGDHVRLHPGLDRGPRCDDANWHDEGREQHERHRNAVDAKLVQDRVREPVAFLDKLKARLRRVEAAPGDKAQHEGDQSREQGDPARVSLGRLAIARKQQDEQRANQRQRQNAGEDPRAVHRVTPPNRYQVVSAAAPSSIAKA